MCVCVRINYSFKKGFKEVFIQLYSINRWFIFTPEIINTISKVKLVPTSIIRSSVCTIWIRSYNTAWQLYYHKQSTPNSMNNLNLTSFD